jgi:hypothetical protein
LSVRSLPTSGGRVAVNRGGFCVAVFYLFIVVFVYASISLTTKPSNAGYDWIPFMLLAMPWYGINTGLLFPGLIANAGISYLLGILFDKLFCRIVRK